MAGAERRPTVTAHQLARVDVDGLVAGSHRGPARRTLTSTLLPGVSMPLVLDQERAEPGRDVGLFGAQPRRPGELGDHGRRRRHRLRGQYLQEHGLRDHHLSNSVHRIAKIEPGQLSGDKVVEGENPNLPLSSTSELTSVGVVAAATPTAENEARPGEAPSRGTLISVAILATEAARSDHTESALLIARAAVSDANASFRAQRRGP